MTIHARLYVQGVLGPPGCFSPGLARRLLLAAGCFSLGLARWLLALFRFLDASAGHYLTSTANEITVCFLRRRGRSAGLHPESRHAHRSRSPRPRPPSAENDIHLR